METDIQAIRQLLEFAIPVAINLLCMSTIIISGLIGLHMGMRR